MVKRVKCLKLKSEGGMGIGLSLLNQTSLAKWNGRFANKTHTSWKSIRIKYGAGARGGITKVMKNNHRAAMLNAIKKEGEETLNCIKFPVGNGQKVKFWIDLRCGTMRSANKFRNQNRPAESKETAMAKVYGLDQNNINWNLGLPRDFNDWGIGGVNNLYQLLKNQTINVMVEQKMRWRPEKMGMFSVKFCYIVKGHKVSNKLASYGWVHQPL